jgi:hypothetical protein
MSSKKNVCFLIHFPFIGIIVVLPFFSSDMGIFALCI